MATSGGSSNRRGLSDGLAEEDVARSGQRQRACLRDRGARATNVGFVELQRRAQLDDRRRRVPDGREPVADLVVGVARMDASRVARAPTRGQGGSRRCSLRGSTHGADRGARPGRDRQRAPCRRAVAGEGYGPPDPMCVPASVMRGLPPHLRGFPHEVQLSCPSDETPSSLSGPCRWRRARRCAPQRSRSTSARSSSVSFQRSKTRTPAGLFPPVSAAMTIGTSGRRARAAFAVRNASATASAPSRTAMSTLGLEDRLRQPLGRASAPRPRGRVRRAGSARAGGTEDRCSRRGRARAARRRRRRTSRCRGRFVASAALRDAHATRSPTSSPRRRDSPAASSTTSRAPRHETVRHGPISCSTLMTTWSASRKTASIGKRMNAVWMLQPGRRTMPSPCRRYLRPRRPRMRRCARSATTTRSQTIRPSSRRSVSVAIGPPSRPSRARRRC